MVSEFLSIREKAVSMKMESGLYDALKNIADSNGMNISSVIRQILTETLEEKGIKISEKKSLLEMI